MDSSTFDKLTRRFAGSRREALAALGLGALVALGGIADGEARKRKPKKNKTKKHCKSRCAGTCCKQGTAGALLFPEDGFGCTCCPKDRIWRGSTGVKRCCALGTRAVAGLTTNGGPCCPEENFCNGECCNSGYVCKDGQCTETCAEREVAAQLKTGAVARRGEVTVENVPCDWPGNAQQACITGYMCTDRFVCCRAEETPCGGSPGQRGACCTADEVCNPKFDADPDKYNSVLDGRPCLKRC